MVATTNAGRKEGGMRCWTENVSVDLFPSVLVAKVSFLRIFKLSPLNLFLLRLGSFFNFDLNKISAQK